MPETKRIVINTGPVISLVAAMGDLTFLTSLYEQVLVPFKVCHEIHAGGKSGFAIAEFDSANFLNKQTSPLIIPPFLSNMLDLGEASVIKPALEKRIQTVCIDEPAGRRMARLNGLNVTGSIGVLIRAKKEGLDISVKTAIEKKLKRGIRLSDRVVRAAMEYDNSE